MSQFNSIELFDHNITDSAYTGTGTAKPIGGENIHFSWSCRFSDDTRIDEATVDGAFDDEQGTEILTYIQDFAEDTNILMDAIEATL